MSLELQVVSALVLDTLWGDPRWLPHPVRLMGWLALRCESVTRTVFPSERLAGTLTVIMVLAGTGLSGWILVWLSGVIHPVVETVVSVLLLYTCFAGRDMMGHSHMVYLAVRDEDLPEARRRVGMIVGRDTAGLSKSGVARACVESVAESMVDGVTAPLFWAIIGGPLGALLYKATNTMDSTFGYKNGRYLKFGWAAARLDDLLNYVPARVTGILTVLASFILRLKGRRAWRIFRRDRMQHASPNSGHTEAAVAGALGLQFGGSNYYFGEIVVKPTIGDPLEGVKPDHILLVNRLFIATSVLAGIVLLAGRIALLACF